MKAKIKNAKVQSELSIERTKMANRRTLLAYIRSAVGLIVAGAGLMKFINSTVWIVIGMGCIILAPITLIFGIYDYFCCFLLFARQFQYSCYHFKKPFRQRYKKYNYRNLIFPQFHFEPEPSDHR